MAYSVKHNTDLSAAHTFGLQGNTSECFVEYDSAEDLPAILADESLPRPILPVGGGSNMFFDGNFKGTILHCINRTITVTGADTMEASAAAVLDDICAMTVDLGLWGAESLSGIPGELSGAIVQNAGAYGAEMADIVESVDVYDIANRRFATLTKEECRFGYRSSIFKDYEPTAPRYIITGARLKLHRVKPERQSHRNIELTAESTPQSIRKSVIELRESKLPNPAVIGSAGSFFKNPLIDIESFNRIQQTETSVIPAYPVDAQHVKVPAAWLIDHCGFKGHAEGGVAVWHKQPLVLVNLNGQATAAEVNTLSSLIIRTVAERYGITLEREVICIK